jgi:hypothetical protein
MASGDDLLKNRQEIFAGIGLSVFTDRIRHYSRLYDEVCELPTSVCLVWLRVNAKPLKESLKTLAHQWQAVYVAWLLENAKSQLTSLQQFIAQIDEGLVCWC